MLLTLCLMVPLQIGAVLSPDSIEVLRDQARAVEARYERRVRQRAPLSRHSGAGGDCDEIVGRFCLRFDSTSVPPAQSEHRDVTVLRVAAVDAARRYFRATPGQRAAAGPLVRLLIASGHASEAVRAARTFAAASSDSLWRHLLLGTSPPAAG